MAIEYESGLYGTFQQSVLQLSAIHHFQRRDFNLQCEAENKCFVVRGWLDQNRSVQQFLRNGLLNRRQLGRVL